MEVIEMRIGGKREAKRISWAKVARITGQIMVTAAKVGLYVGTGVAVSRAVVKAADVANTRPVIPGGEIFTIPLIAALFVVGWVLRGDVEATIRKYERERRRRQQHDRRV